jgi:hypothetical protein
VRKARTWGAHSKEGRARGARTATKDCIRGAHSPGGVRGKGGAHGEGGAHGQGVGTDKGRARQGGDTFGRRARPRVAWMAWMASVAWLPWVAWAHTRTPIIGTRTGGAHGSKEGPIYVLPSSFEFAKPSLPGSLPST